MRFLSYVGRSPLAPSGSFPPLRHEGEALEPGARLPIRRSRSPWSSLRDTERVIVGSHPARADVLLVGEGIRPEHVRLYVPKEDQSAPVDLLVIQPDSTWCGGDLVEPREWTSLTGGEELDFGPWRFRYEAEASP